MCIDIRFRALFLSFAFFKFFASLFSYAYCYAAFCTHGNRVATCDEFVRSLQVICINIRLLVLFRSYVYRFEVMCISLKFCVSV